MMWISGFLSILFSWVEFAWYFVIQTSHRKDEGELWRSRNSLVWHEMMCLIYLIANIAREILLFTWDKCFFHERCSSIEILRNLIDDSTQSLPIILFGVLLYYILFVQRIWMTPASKCALLNIHYYNIIIIQGDSID